jgi:gas vesicle protein
MLTSTQYLDSLGRFFGMSDNNGAKVVWFMAGFSAGAVVALLLAPRSGQETRELIGKKVDEGRDFAAAKGKEFRRAAEDLVGKGRRTAEDLVDKGKDLVAKIPV